MDRISELPEPILHHILINYLGEKDAARTACLSKSWRAKFRSRPVLKFDHCLYDLKIDYSKLNRDELKSIEPVRRSRWSFFMDQVNNSIERVIETELGLNRFSLEAECSVLEYWQTGLNRWTAGLDRWVKKLVVEAKVNDFSIKLTRMGHHYMLPPVVVMSQTISHLTLSNCDLGKCDSVSLPNLLFLSLTQVRLRDEAFEQFISGSPNLETLNLLELNGPSSIRVSGLARLHTVVVAICHDDWITSVEIVAPSLRVFEFVTTFQDIGLLDCQLSACESSLRKLTLDGATSEVESFVSRFVGLEELVLSSIRVNSIKISNQNLRKVKVCSCMWLSRVDIDAPNLDVFEYYDNNLNSDLSLNLNDSIDFYGKFSFDHNEVWLQHLEKFVHEFNKLKNMKLVLKFDHSMEVVICENVDENFRKFIHKVNDKNLKIELMCTATHECMVLDRLFLDEPLRRWKTISIISRERKNNRNFLEILRKKTKKENELPKCCEDTRRKCWKHYLLDVEMNYEETRKTSGLFECDNVMKFEIMHIKLHWIQEFDPNAKSFVPKQTLARSPSLLRRQMTPIFQKLFKWPTTLSTFQKMIR